VRTGEVSFADVGAVRLAYERLGDPDGVPVLMVMGQGTQMLAWPDGLCRLLTARGLHLIRYDHRDAGLSTHLHGAGLLAYSLDDLATDASGLLDALGLASVHVVGMSMGAMVGQLLAIRHPERVRSLTCIASSTGSRRVGRPSPRLLRRLPVRRAAADRTAAGEVFARVLQAIGSPAYPVDAAVLRDLGARCYDRAHDPQGGLRQLLAVVRAPDRTAALRRLQVATLVVHGDADPLVAVSGGRALAAAVPGARLVTVRGLGHDLPPQVWPLLVDEVAGLVARSQAARRGTQR
jgi:pimeloyl-ACP methyl ester carboxylesterase